MRKWTNDEVDFLINNYQKLTDGELGLKLNRTKDAIERKRANLKLSKNTSLKLDSSLEKEILSCNLTYSEISAKYQITYEQVRGIFRKNGKKSIGHNKLWNKTDDNYLIENYQKKSDLEMSLHLNRTPIAVFKRRKKMGLIREERIIFNPPEKTWSKEEEIFLLDNFDKISLSEISFHLNRSLKAVSLKASRLGIIENGSLWSHKEDEILKEYRNLSVHELSFLLNRSSKAIKHRASKLGLKLGDTLHNTSIEKKMHMILLELEIPFETQRKLGKDFNYRADFVVGNIVIETNGDYWHGNPLFYPQPNEMQKMMILKDDLKRKYFESLGYKVCEFWEYDIINNYLYVKEAVARLLGNQQDEREYIGEGAHQLCQRLETSR